MSPGRQQKWVSGTVKEKRGIMGEQCCIHASTQGSHRGACEYIFGIRDWLWNIGALWVAG